MFKLVPHADQLPRGATLVPLDVDGYDLPNDWYLQLACETGRMLRGESPSSRDLPLPEPLPIPHHPSVEIQLGITNLESGIELLPSGGDGLHHSLVVKCTPGVQTTPMTANAPESYLYFKVSDPFYHNQPEPIDISVEYYDEGNEPIYLQYDAAPEGSNWDPATMYKSIELASRQDTRTWRIASVRIRDARLVGHQDGEADFRLETGPAPLTVGYVRIQKLQ